MSRIKNTLADLKKHHRKALIPFITAGDPHPDSTVQLMHDLVTGGADLIELGVPFSDPMADGPVIQRASERALRHHIGLEQIFDFVARFRKKDSNTPVILMGYANPIERMGYAEFAQRASQAGVDGVLTVDFPPEEIAPFASHLERYHLDPIFLVAPTTPEHRIRHIADMANGFIYYVSLKGVTGSSNINIEEIQANLAKIRKYTTLPIGVGFGVRDTETAKAVTPLADAVVIGSRIVSEIEGFGYASPVRLSQHVIDLIAEFRTAIDNATRFGV